MKTVAAGAHYTTVEVDTAEAVKFSFPSTSLSVEASGGDITVALTDTAQAGDDETITVPDGETRMFIHHRMNVDTYYLSGSGTAKLYASNMSDVNPFKGKSKGGDGGGDNTHYKGTTTTPLENGSTTNPIVIDGESYTAVFGDVVVYGYTEFVFDGTQWSEFGRPFDTVPTLNSTNAVTSDGVFRNTAGRKYFVNNEVKGLVLGSVYCKASGGGSLAEGFNTTASGSFSHSEGSGSVASNTYSHAEGQQTTASGASSHAEGRQTVASGNGSHATGFCTIANKEDSTVIGKYNVADTDVAHLFIVGNGTENARSNILEVSETDMNVNGDIQQNGVPIRATTMPTITASMLGAVVQYVGASNSNYKKSWNYVAVSDGAEPPAYSWQALMDTTPTQGSTNAVTSGGVYNSTPFMRSGATGAVMSSCTATARGSFAIGNGSKSTATNSIATGYYTIASDGQAFAEGYHTTASKGQAHASGYYTTASAYNSYAGGSYTIANTDNSTAIGKYNVADTDVKHLLIVGNGTATDARSNILEVSETDMNVNGDIKINNIAIPTPYTTMPTITESMLGKIAMYVGATGSGYTQGCFYVASTDGAAEPTYSWVKIGGGRTETVLWENTGTTNPDTITLSEAWSNFDELAIVTTSNDSVASRYESTKHTSTMTIGSVYTLWYNSETTWGTYSATSSTVFTKVSAGGDYHIAKIIGIKY